jgi:hypothetical protein
MSTSVPDFNYDPIGPGVLRVRFAFRERLAYSRELDFFRTLEYDENDEVVGVTFLGVNERAIDLDGVPRADEIAEAIRAFRAATAQFHPVVAKG